MNTLQERDTVATLKVTAKGQVTLRKDVLEHLGVRPGEKLVVERLPEGRLVMRSAAEKTGDISDIFGIFKRENGPHLSIEEINEVIAGAWAGER